MSAPENNDTPEAPAPVPPALDLDTDDILANLFDVRLDALDAPEDILADLADVRMYGGGQ